MAVILPYVSPHEGVVTVSGTGRYRDSQRMELILMYLQSLKLFHYKRVKQALRSTLTQSLATLGNPLVCQARLA